MVVANGWPLLERCKSCDSEAIARLRLALKSRLNAAVGGDDISNIPWRVSEHKFVVEAFATIVRFLLPRTAGDKEFFLGVTEEGDTNLEVLCVAAWIRRYWRRYSLRQANAIFLFVVAVSKRAAARRTETAFKRRPMRIYPCNNCNRHTELQWRR